MPGSRQVMVGPPQAAEIGLDQRGGRFGGRFLGSDPLGGGASRRRGGFGRRLGREGLCSFHRGKKLQQAHRPDLALLPACRPRGGSDLQALPGRLDRQPRGIAAGILRRGVGQRLLAFFAAGLALGRSPLVLLAHDGDVHGAVAGGALGLGLLRRFEVFQVGGVELHRVDLLALLAILGIVLAAGFVFVPADGRNALEVDLFLLGDLLQVAVDHFVGDLDRLPRRSFGRRLVGLARRAGRRLLFGCRLVGRPAPGKRLVARGGRVEMLRAGQRAGSSSAAEPIQAGQRTIRSPQGDGHAHHGRPMPRGPERPLRHEHDLPGPGDSLAAGELAQPAVPWRIRGELQCGGVKVARSGTLVEQLRQATRPRRPTVPADCHRQYSQRSRNRYAQQAPKRQSYQAAEHETEQAGIGGPTKPQQQPTEAVLRDPQPAHSPGELADRFHEACSAGTVSRIWRMIVSG